MFNVGTCVVGRTLIVTVALSMLNACVYGVPLVTPIDAASLIIAGDAVAAINNVGEPIETKVSGNYENGFWFDRDLYWVWVVADSSEEARRVANLTATDSCLKHGHPLRIVNITDSEHSRNLFVRLGANRPSYEMKFRCEAVKADAD